MRKTYHIITNDIELDAFTGFFYCKRNAIKAAKAYSEKVDIIVYIEKINRNGKILNRGRAYKGIYFPNQNF